MIDSSTAWKLLSQRPGPTVVLAKMYYGDESEYLPIGSGLVNLENEDFIPLITTVPHRFQEVDFWTREFTVADLTLEILNMPFHGSTRFSDLLDERGSGNDIGFENRPVDVRLWRPGITTWDDCFSLFPAGLMRKPYVQGGIAYVEVQDYTFLTLQNVQLDRLQDSDAAAAEGGVLPEESRGKIQPRVYGDFTQTLGDTTSANYTTKRPTKADMTPLRYLGLDASGHHKWMVSKHVVNQINVNGDEIWGQDPTLGRLVQLKVYAIDNTGPCYITHAQGVSFHDYLYPDGTVSNESTAGGDDGVGTVTDPEQMGDRDNATAGSVYTKNATAGVTQPHAFVNIDFPTYTANGTVNSSAVLARAAFSGSAVKVDNTINAVDAESPGADFESYGNTVNPGDSVQVKSLCTDHDGGQPERTLTVYEIFKDIDYVPSQPKLDLYFLGKGAEIDANWTNRAVVDGYDDQHADHGGSGNLAENPATLIELTLRNEAGLGDSRLNLNSFNTASVAPAISSLKGAPVFLEQPDSYLQALLSLVQQFRGFLWWTPEGELFLKILEDDYTTPNITIDGGLIISLKSGRTDIKRLYTAVQLLYKGRDGQDVVETPLVEDTTAQTWYNISQTESLLKFPADAIREQASAVSVGDYFLANHLNIHSTVECELPIMFNRLDVGDLVGFENLPENVRGHDLSASYTIAGQIIRPYFLINSVDRSDSMNFEAFQVHKLD